MGASAHEVNPAEGTINDDHVGDELPVILLQDGVSAEGVDEASDSWDCVDELEVDASSPSEVFVLTVDLLLLLSEHEPVE